MNKKFFYLPAILIFFLQSFLYSEGLNEYIRFFSSFPSRMPGTEGHRYSADFIEKKFKEAGLKKVKKETFQTAVPVEKYAYIVVDNKRIDVHCLWPNLVRTSTVPPDGIVGKLIYGGNGDLRNFTGRDIEGNIVVLDFDSGTRWQTLAMLGAKAFIFTDTGDITRIQAEQKFVGIPVNIPRFYAHNNSQMIIELARKEKEVNLFSRMDWENVTDYNIYGYLEGRDKKLKEEVIILQAYYDSISVVPSVAPGASSACGISTLLDILDYFSAHPPERTVVFLATSSHFQARSGINDFIQRHLRQEPLFKKRILKDDIINLKLFIGLDLSDGSDNLGIWQNSYEFYTQRVFAPYGRKFMEYADKVSRYLGYKRESALVNGISPERGIIWQTFLPEKIRTDGELVIVSGNPAISFVTVNDGRWRVDTPSDTYENLNIVNITKQAVFLKEILKVAINDPDLFPEIELGMIKDNLCTLNAKIVTFDPTKSFVPSEPVFNAVVIPRVHPKIIVFEKTSIGVRNIPIGITDKNGKVVFSSLSSEDRLTLSAFYIDRETGEITLSPDLGIGGAGQYPVVLSMDYKEKNWMIVLFESKTISLTGLIDPQYLMQLDKIEILDMANSVPSEYGYFLQYPEFIPFRWSSYSEPLGCVFARLHMKVKLLGQAGPLGKRLLLLNSKEGSKETSEGIGFEIDKTDFVYNTPYQAAKDMIILDTYRRERSAHWASKQI
ncbi:MAG: M28 family metallopeptidase [Candidatus Omnitrophica bacterium]|nr:M28 family metallopeptidase [Candidatus Omnitrophota bacterium]